jgi:uncharacterized protein YbjT (DUF2867 family)
MTRQKPILVLGSTGKTGRRVVERLTARGLPTRLGARSAEPRFDWDDRDTWAPVLQGVGWAPRYRGGRGRSRAGRRRLEASIDWYTRFFGRAPDSAG